MMMCLLSIEERTSIWFTPIVRMPLIGVYLRCRSPTGVGVRGGDEAVKYMTHFISFFTNAVPDCFCTSTSRECVLGYTLWDNY